ncbi:hypothetical protein V501_07434 [Pseudogymnoascus sp. VKM F-4519 (FW-2642)]|nr:hypothetical protein V501_07434 [Pseudogymnoascus sp. VKM F-4519 (FW-2642)]
MADELITWEQLDILDTTLEIDQPARQTRTPLGERNVNRQTLDARGQTSESFWRDAAILRRATKDKIDLLEQEINQSVAYDSRHAERTALSQQKVDQMEARIKQLEAVQPGCDYPETCVLKPHPGLSAADQAYEAALWANLPLATKKTAVAEEPATVEEHTAAEGAVAKEVSEVEEVVAMVNGAGN